MRPAELVAGIDYDSEGVYLVLVDVAAGAFQGLQRFDLAVQRGETAIERARRIPLLLPGRDRWRHEGVIAVGLEDTRSRSYTAASALKRVQGAIIACLGQDVDLYPLQANTRDGWKGLNGLPANASKDRVKVWARDHGAPPAIRQDYYDAFGLARAARELVNRRVRGQQRGAV